MGQFVISVEPYISLLSTIGLVAFFILFPIFMVSQTDLRFRVTLVGLVVCLITSLLDFGWFLAVDYVKRKEVTTHIQTAINEKQTLVLCGAVVSEPENFYKELRCFRTSSSKGEQDARRYTLEIVSQTGTTSFVIRRDSQNENRVYLYYPKYDPDEYNAIGGFSLDLPGMKELFDACPE